MNENAGEELADMSSVSHTTNNRPQDGGGFNRGQVQTLRTVQAMINRAIRALEEPSQTQRDAFNDSCLEIVRRAIRSRQSSIEVELRSCRALSRAISGYIERGDFVDDLTSNTNKERTVTTILALGAIVQHPENRQIYAVLVFEVQP